MEYSYQCLHFAKEATAPAAQTCYIVAYIGIASFDIMGIAFVVDVSFMPTDKIYSKIDLPTVCAVFFCLYCTIYHRLYARSIHRVIHSKSDNLARLPT